MADKKTWGQEAAERLIRLAEQPDSLNPLEIAKETAKEYPKTLQEALEKALERPILHNKDFFIVIYVKLEAMAHNTQRFTATPARLTCPYPEFGQNVYHWHHKEQKLECLWIMPDRQTCVTMLENEFQVADNERWMVQIYKMYLARKLHEVADRLNEVADKYKKPIETITLH